MASVYPPPVTAVQVGSFFVGQYYQVLQKNPDLVHQFYTDDSNMTLIDGSIVGTARAMLEIHSLIMSLGFTAIEIKTAHSMESWHGGVLVVVYGLVQTKESSGKRRFIQTFFLAPQEKGYFVLNDVFQFISDEQMHLDTSAIVDHEHYNPKHEHYDPELNNVHYNSELSSEHYNSELNLSRFNAEVSHEDYDSELNHEHYDSELNASNPIPESGNMESDFVPDMHANEIEAVDKYSISEPQQQISEIDNRVKEEILVEEPSISHSSPRNISRETPPLTFEEPLGEPIKHTYASILRNSKGHSRPLVPQPQPSSSRNTPVASGWDDIPQSAPVQSYPAQSIIPEKPSSETVEDTPVLDDEGEVTSVYVRNLPSSASASELEQEFKNFGIIKPDGVLIKSRKEVGVYYAFVEFEDISGVHNAVKASPIQFNGRPIYVEERRPNASLTRGRRGRGRGGYQPEGSRGRFGGRSFGRGNLHDNSIREYTGRPRGNGSVRSSRQEKGILGPQGLRNGQHSSEFVS